MNQARTLLRLFFEAITKASKPGWVLYGFDLTTFDHPKDFQALLKLVGIDPKAEPDYQQGQGYQWRGSNILIVTANNPITGQYDPPNRRSKEVGYASYVGIEGKPAFVNRAVEYIKSHAADIKDESPGKREFI